VPNQIPPKLTYGLVETIAVKLTRPLPATTPRALTYAEGNFAVDSAKGSPARIQSVLVDTQWVVLSLGIVLIVLAGPRPRLLASIGAVLGIAVAGGVFFVLFRWPAIRNMPPDPLVKAVNAGDVEPDTRAMPEESVRMVERGHYLYSVSCAICHGNDGSGGTPISWRPFGTLWTRNITPHPQAGVGAWTDAELERAVRSGVSRDGRQLHWQGMTWDQFSNLDEEDLRAIVAYLRLLRPVNRAVPLPRPPAADDCETYTFYLEKSDQPGCR
jgi:mono/diheme cytochrome c family protein